MVERAREASGFAGGPASSGGAAALGPAHSDAAATAAEMDADTDGTNARTSDDSDGGDDDDNDNGDSGESGESAEVLAGTCELTLAPPVRTKWVGPLRVPTDGTSCYVSNMTVAPEFRRRGVGAAMLAALEAIALSRRPFGARLGPQQPAGIDRRMPGTDLNHPPPGSLCGF